MPPAQSSATKAPVASAERPTLGLMMVPISGRPCTPDRLLVPFIPNFGPGYCWENSIGNLTSKRRIPDRDCSSNRFPAIVDIRFGREGPILSSGQVKVTLALRQLCPLAGRVAPNKEAALTVSSSSIFSIRAAARSLSCGVSLGTARKVPEDCSPAIISAATLGSIDVSIR